MAQRSGYIYLLTNKTNSVIYTGVTSDLKKRIYEHREKLAKGFSAKYNVVKLVHYEIFDNIADAILREKQIKSGPRAKKIELITANNPEFRDLYDEI